MENATTEIKQVIRELDRLSEKLASQVRPGHVDYISKDLAGKWVKILSERLAAYVDGGAA